MPKFNFITSLFFGWLDSRECAVHEPTTTFPFFPPRHPLYSPNTPCLCASSDVFVSLPRSENIACLFSVAFGRGRAIFLRQWTPGTDWDPFFIPSVFNLREVCRARSVICMKNESFKSFSPPRLRGDFVPPLRFLSLFVPFPCLDKAELCSIVFFMFAVSYCKSEALLPFSSFAIRLRITAPPPSFRRQHFLLLPGRVKFSSSECHLF